MNRLEGISVCLEFLELYENELCQHVPVHDAPASLLLLKIFPCKLLSSPPSHFMNMAHNTLWVFNQAGSHGSVNPSVHLIPRKS